MGLNGRLAAISAGSGKLLKRMSLIINEINFGDMLDIAKWLRLRRALLTTVCHNGTESRETLPLWKPA